MHTSWVVLQMQIHQMEDENLLHELEHVAPRPTKVSNE